MPTQPRYLWTTKDEGKTSTSHRQTPPSRESVIERIVRRHRKTIRRRLPRWRFFQLTRADWWLLATMAVAQVVAAAALHAMPLPALRTRISRFRRLARFFVRGSDERIIWAIEATGRRLGRVSTCLLRALVAELVLDPKGGTICLTIGIKRTADTLEAHAWLARNGRVLIGAPAEGYAPLVNWTSPSA